MTTLNQVIATNSSYLFSKADALLHVLSGEMHCTTGHLELALSMLSLIFVSLYVLTGIIAMINMVLGNVVHGDPMCPPVSRGTGPIVRSDKESVSTRIHE